jgi:6-phospho-beta-glucosidase
VGGMAKALRTIPVLLKLADDIRRLSPEALLVNFTNPSGLVTQALSMYAPDVAVVELCIAPLNAKMDFLHKYEEISGKKYAPDKAQLDTLGLNHLTWHRGFTVEGRDVWPQVLQAVINELLQEEEPLFSPRVVEMLGMLPNYYLSYYYHTDHKLAEQENWPPSRAEAVMEIEEDLLRQYADVNLKEPPADMMKRGGAYYSTAATQLLNAHYNDLGEIHVLNICHAGAVSGWPQDWVLEMPCKVNRNKITPLPVEPLPPACFGLMAHVKAYELLTAQAGARGDRQAAYQALLTHPLGPRGDRVQALLDDMLETHRAHLPQFFSAT